MKTFKGIGVSEGYVIANAVLYNEPHLVASEKFTTAQQEIANVNVALEKSKAQINKIKDRSLASLGADKAEIFDAHLGLIEDPELTANITNLINENKMSAQKAVEKAFNDAAAVFLSLEDPYFRERAVDLRDIGRRMLANLVGVNVDILADINSDCIIIARDLTPSDAAQLNPKYVKGFVMEVGSRTSHTAIIAKTMKVPAVLGLENALNTIPKEAKIALDGKSGEVIVEPSSEQIDAILKKQQKFFETQKIIAEYIDKPSNTRDGLKLLIEANVGSSQDIDKAKKGGAEGIGLFRTEFLYMESSQWPTEEAQFTVYKKAVETFPHEMVVIRTLDIGGDKNLPYHKFDKEDNPFLGNRAIRFCLSNPTIFKVQLRALLRASSFGKLGIMLPMIATIDEINQSKKLIAECHEELKKQNIKIGDYKVGVMIEIPAAAVLADVIAQHVDFMSIGTNDLIQYSFAADRMETKVSYLYQPLHPALLRLIKNVGDAAKKYNKIAAVCGEMGGDPSATEMLIAANIHYLSMSVSSVPIIRHLASTIDYKQARQKLEHVINLTSESEVVKYLGYEKK